MRISTQAWKLSKVAQVTRRRGIALILSTLITAFGPEEAVARFHGGIVGPGGGPPVTTTLTPWTITEQSGSPQTMIPVEIQLPFSAYGGTYAFSTSDAVQGVDADGTTVLSIDENNRCSDINPTPGVRAATITALVPSITANQKRQLTLKKVTNSSPATGTDISVADLVAASFNCTASLAYKDGVTYTASALTGLQAGAWTAKTAAANTGTWRSGGGIVTEYIVYCPFKNGSSYTPNFLGMWFSVTAYKAQRTAVSGPNPIIGIRVKPWFECGWVQTVTTAVENHWGDLTITSGANSQSWVGTASPGKTLTISGANASVPAGGGFAFSQNSVGQVITDTGGGLSVIIGYTDPQNVTINTIVAMMGTSISAANWRTYGINHRFSSTFPQQEIWYSGAGVAITAKPNVDSTLGVAWNTGTLTGGPYSYFKDCGMILPYSTPASAISNDMTKLNAMGTNPCAVGNGFAGDWTMYMPSTGGRDDIAPIPGWYVGGIIRADANAKPRIFGNAAQAAGITWFYRDQNTGKAFAFNGGVDWNINGPPWAGQLLPQSTAYYSGGACPQMNAWEAQDAHHPGPFYIPWLYTGDFFWAEKHHQMLFWTWAANNPDYTGSQFNRCFTTSSELRGNGWNWRDLMHAIMMTPDSNPTPLSYNRSSLRTLYDAQFSAVNSGIVGTAPYPGITMSVLNNTGPGKSFATSGPRSSIGGQGAQWQLEYGIMAFFLGKAMGMMSSDMLSFLTWQTEGVTGAATNANVVPNWIVPVYYVSYANPWPTNVVNTWTDCYRATAVDVLQTGANKRTVGAAATLSGTSGTALTVTMPGGYLTNGGNAFYGGGQAGGGGFLMDGNAASFQCVPMTLQGFYAYPHSADPYQWNAQADFGSHSNPLPTNNGSIVLYNYGANPLYIKLTVGPGTATTSDTLVAAGGNVTVNVGSNTYLNWISPLSTVFVIFGSKGSGYAVNDTINITVDNVAVSFTVSRTAQLKVLAVGPNGDVQKLSINDPGLFIANNPFDTGAAGNSVTQTATSGAGTGWSYLTAARDSEGSDTPIRFGMGIIASVSGNVMTLDTSYTNACTRNGLQRFCYPFAQTGLVSGKFIIPAPAPGDSNGVTGVMSDPFMPIPYGGTVEYWSLALQAAYMCNLQGYPNGAAAYSYIASAYTGTNELKWRVSP